jgi:hypothetical protein
MSTKCTLLYGKNFHVYTEPFEYLPYIEFNHKKIEAPEDFKKALKDLIRLHEAMKTVIETSKKLDEIDGGLFMINIKSGKTKEFK